jgi:hypothetical protein
MRQYDNANGICGIISEEVIDGIPTCCATVELLHRSSNMFRHCRRTGVTGGCTWRSADTALPVLCVAACPTLLHEDGWLDYIRPDLILCIPCARTEDNKWNSCRMLQDLTQTKQLVADCYSKKAGTAARGQ